MTHTFDLSPYIRPVPDFPKPGILFRDITPLLSAPTAFAAVITWLTQAVRNSGATAVVGMESRGFIFGAPVALQCHLPFVPVRKPGKLPAATIAERYSLEYGNNELHIHTDALAPGARVAVIDDLLATGGTAAATCRLVEKLGATVTTCLFVIELKELKGRAKLSPSRVEAMIGFP